jgi:hypothetical protein
MRSLGGFSSIITDILIKTGNVDTGRDTCIEERQYEDTGRVPPISQGIPEATRN